MIYHVYRASTYFWRGAFLEEKTAGSGKADLDKAFVDINNAINTSPKLALLYSVRGQFYSTLENFDFALADYTKAIKLKPKDANYYKNRAAVYRVKRDNQAAIADYTKAIEINPNNARLYSLRGKIFYFICDGIDKYTDDANKRNEREEARLKGIADFKKALQINPEEEEDTLAFLEILEMP